MLFGVMIFFVFLFFEFVKIERFNFYKLCFAHDAVYRNYFDD